MNDSVFIDTNIFIYAKIENNNSSKHKKSIDFFSSLKDEVCISTQILSEFYNALYKNKIADEKIQKSINEILEDVSLKIINIETLKKCWEIREKYNYSYYDTLVIASALQSNCKILYSEDLHDNQIIDDKLTIVNPLI